MAAISPGDSPLDLNNVKNELMQIYSDTGEFSCRDRISQTARSTSDGCKFSLFISFGKTFLYILVGTVRNNQQTNNQQHNNNNKLVS